MIRQQLSRVHCRHGAWRAQRYVVFCLNARARVTVMTTSWTKESNFYKIKPLLIGQLQRKVYHRVCQSLICSSEKSEPHLFPYSRVVVCFVACCGYNVDRCSFAPKDGVSRQKTRPNVLLPLVLFIYMITYMIIRETDHSGAHVWNGWHTIYTWLDTVYIRTFWDIYL